MADTTQARLGRSTIPWPPCRADGEGRTLVLPTEAAAKFEEVTGIRLVDLDRAVRKAVPGLPPDPEVAVRPAGPKEPLFHSGDAPGGRRDVVDELAAELAAYRETMEQFDVNRAGGDVNPEQHAAAVAASLAPVVEDLYRFAVGPNSPGSAWAVVAHWHGRSVPWWQRLAASLAELHATLQDLAGARAPMTSGGRGPGRPPEPFRPFADSISRILAERCGRKPVFATSLLFAARELVDDSLLQNHPDGRCIQFDLLRERVAGARKKAARGARGSRDAPPNPSGK